MSINDEAQNKQHSVSPQGPVIGCEADASASSTVGVPVAATAKKIGPTSASGAFNSLNKEQAWPSDPQKGLKILAIQAGVVLRLIACRHQPVAKTSARHLRVKRLGRPQGGSEVPNWEFLFRCGPSKPLRFKLSYQKTSSQDSGNVPVIGLCSAIDQKFTVPTGQIVAAADRNNHGSPWERRLYAVGSDCLGVGVWK